MPEETWQEIDNGLHRVITGPGTTSDFYHSTTGEKLFYYYPDSAIPLAGKTGTAQGAGNYPVERLVGLRGVQPRPVAAVHGDGVSREVRVRVAGSGAGREVHVPADVGLEPSDPVVLSEQLDTNSNRAGAAACADRHDVLQRPVRRRRPSERIAVAASVPLAQARLRSRQHRCQPRRHRAATSTGCCCRSRRS